MKDTFFVYEGFDIEEFSQDSSDSSNASSKMGYF